MKDLKKVYKDSGVDLNKADLLVRRIKELSKTTYTQGVISEIGLFGGMFKLDLQKVKQPVLVSSADGVGTKLKIAFAVGKHDTVGIDLVAMNVNDIIVHGAKPLFFLDYMAFGRLDVEVAEEIIKGIVKGCKEAGCALLGGETAEMPDFYNPEEYELSGFCVGIVDYDEIIDGSDISIGDVLIGISSSGVHSNGFSLIRKILRDKRIDLSSKFPSSDKTVGEELLTPTKIYVNLVLNLIKNFHIKGIVHITGGGFYDNIPRILPRSAAAHINFNSWPKKEIFSWIKSYGDLSWEEMCQVFNCGIGMVVIVKKEDVNDVLSFIKAFKEDAWVIGEVVHWNLKSSHVKIFF